MRLINLLLLTLLAVLQFQLWFGQGGLRDAWQLDAAIHDQRQENDRLEARNRALAAQVIDLKSGSEAVEELARTELGLVSPDEEFYQIVESPHRH